MGGQAVIEGVLMRSRQGYSVALRRSNGDVLVRSVPFRSLTSRFRALKLPFVRGGLALFEMMAIGYQALRFSAEEADKDARRQELEKQASDAASSGGSAQSPASPTSPTSPTSPASAPISAAPEPQPSSTTSPPPAEALPQDAVSAWSSWAMAGIFLFSFGLAIAMMVVAPNLLTALLGRSWAYAAGLETGNPLVEEQRPLLYNLVSGGFRAMILLGYIWGISRLPEIRRVFEYHGAEHKAVFALESGGPLTSAHAQTFTTLHPRCGTSFLVIVLAVSILVFACVAWAYAAFWPGFAQLPFLVKKALIFVGHIIVLPVVAGCSYEFLKVSARCASRGTLQRWLIWPGLQVQRITTQPPDDSQVAVALISLRAALAIGPDQKEECTWVVPAGQEETSNGEGFAGIAPGVQAVAAAASHANSIGNVENSCAK